MLYINQSTKDNPRVRIYARPVYIENVRHKNQTKPNQTKPQSIRFGVTYMNHFHHSTLSRAMYFVKLNKCTTFFTTTISCQFRYSLPLEFHYQHSQHSSSLLHLPLSLCNSTALITSGLICCTMLIQLQYQTFLMYNICDCDIISPGMPTPTS